MIVQPKKFGRYLVLAIAVVFVYKNPVAAAHLAHQAVTVVSNGADALSRFAGAFK